MARDIDIAEFAKRLGDGTVGGRLLYHVAPTVQRAAELEVARAIGTDMKMRNFFTRANPVRAGISYKFVKKDAALVRFRPLGMFTIIARQSQFDPIAAALRSIPTAVAVAEVKLEREDF